MLYRRNFLKLSGAALLGAIGGRTSALAARTGPASGKSGTRFAAYYLNANMYTAVPRHVREDMAWMADVGTRFVCVGVLEQDLWAAHENLALIVEEVERAGMQVLAVPSRWAGLTAGAPKVPSMYSTLNPHTWMVDRRGRTGFAGKVSGVISSPLWPEVGEFFRTTLAELYRQHPRIAGVIIDEPKGFRRDYSQKAVEVLGPDAPIAAHHGAMRDLLSDVCRFAKREWPEKLTIMFQQAHTDDEELAVSSTVESLDYYGVDGRPWTLAEDARMQATDEGQDGGKGKVLLDGRGAKFIALAQAVPGRGSFFLIENHNLPASMLAAMDRHYPDVLDLRPDIAAYYYYPRNVAAPDKAMNIIRGHLKRHRAAQRLDRQDGRVRS